jgi:hypothetical protein
MTTRGKNNTNIWLPVIISILIGQLRKIFKSKRPRSSSVFGCSVNRNHSLLLPFGDVVVP